MPGFNPVGSRARVARGVKVTPRTGIPMGRIDQYYATQFGALLRRLGHRELENGVRRLFTRAERLAARHCLPRPLALARLHARLRRRVGGPAPGAPERFFCDAGLGGLARWLRAAGYQAVWQPALDDPAVIREAHRLQATLLTTDTLMMERGVLRDGVVPSLLVPPTVSMTEQMTLVFEAFGLRLRTPRCMACGGALRRVDKGLVADRIPPKTGRWLDEYFTCEACGRLFWHGTHWGRIRRR
ncbi:MAG: hypothetical protein KGS61_10900, partial [Verrucomicrobia bacterium]|nr:hypothetical protein [Verrucomicrobiota bacterium]